MTSAARRERIIGRWVGVRVFWGPLSVGAALGVLAACGGGTPSARDLAHDTPIAHMHRARCGNCHQRIEPEQRTRGELEVALKRHRKRVHLSESEWADLVDYLAADRREPAASASKESDHAQ